MIIHFRSSRATETATQLSFLVRLPLILQLQNLPRFKPLPEKHSNSTEACPLERDILRTQVGFANSSRSCRAPDMTKWPTTPETLIG
ncbi:hypothetical protein CDAR_282151 [Caerostris darwini]|uniref:Uncharacterized protein n=1 Tax=Caerostris darwini TaxID=1538125 RepID=A0AAV4WPH3_9ARAC|nr:hypothetical protein CDAR_282151 [Caerostris darwini]